MRYKTVIARFLLGCTFLLVLNTCAMATSYDKKQLTLVSGEYLEYADSEQMQNAISSFLMLNPDYEIKVRSFTGDNWQEQMIIALMAREPGMDILPMYNQMFERYVQHDLLMPLSDVPGFDQNVSDWLDISAMLSYKGTLYCVPETITPIYYVWHDKLGQQLGLDKPTDSWAWNDTLQMAEQIASDTSRANVQIFAERSDNVPDLFWQYTSAYWQDMITGIISYDTQEFRELLRIWKDLWDRGMIQDFSKGEMPDPSTVLVVPFTYVEGEERSMASLPKLTREKCMPMSLITLGVNALSQNREKAAELLQIFSSKENVEMCSEGPGIIMKDISYIARIPEAERYISDSEIEAFREAVIRGTRDVDEQAIMKTAKEVFPQYIKGALSADTVIDRLNQAIELSISG